MITILIDIFHATPQARLHRIRIPPENPHDQSPAHGCKHGPRIISYFIRDLGTADDACRRPDQDARQCDGDTRENVDDDLLIDGGDPAGTWRAPAEDEIAAEEAREEGVVWPCWEGMLAALVVRLLNGKVSHLLFQAQGLDISVLTL